MSSRRITGPKGLPLVGSALEFKNDTLGFVQRAVREHGDFFAIKLFGRRIHVVNHPDDIERVLVRAHARMKKDRFTRDLSKVLGDGLVTSDGEHWKKQRKLVSHAFTPAKIRGYADTMMEVAHKAISGWAPDHEIDVHAEMTRITLDIVAKTLFDADVSSDARTVGDAMAVLSDYGMSLEAGLLIPLWAPTPGARRARTAIQSIDGILYRIIKERRASGSEHGDLLSALLHAEEDGQSMDDRELRDECVTLFLAGHETTAIALSYGFYLLAKHPEVAERFRAELARVLGARRPTHSDVEALDFTTRIVKETMRLYPPVWGIGREALTDIEISGHSLKKGAQLAMFQWTVQRDPRWYSDPEAFDPDRWLDSRSADLPRFAYFPFGGGPRVCIGNHFAMMEAVLLLALVGQRFHLELLPGEKLDFRPSITLRPKHPIRMRLRALAPESRRQPVSSRSLSLS
jgi:cytochrome P450